MMYFFPPPPQDAPPQDIDPRRRFQRPRAPVCTENLRGGLVVRDAS
jgi:hypothetical protein